MAASFGVLTPGCVGLWLSQLDVSAGGFQISVPRFLQGVGKAFDRHGGQHLGDDDSLLLAVLLAALAPVLWPARTSLQGLRQGGRALNAGRR